MGLKVELRSSTRSARGKSVAGQFDPAVRVLCQAKKSEIRVL